ncbi:hypothetical protein KPSA1_00752 [Pseudomonas syringae pv. actinidiae]|jgi:hypothetical protein|uniref:Uncharacterized protein n=1 Tax=Pseudomonas syringae pv. actinidiae TaxID=103796 RepID=A0A2V0Q4D1_PSESF|nr:hypothetical protein KPSA1_00752 [Pseudomonas syringae pv. actinidiae]
MFCTFALSARPELVLKWQNRPPLMRSAKVQNPRSGLIQRIAPET